MNRKLLPGSSITAAAALVCVVFCLSPLTLVVQAQGIGANPVEPSGSISTSSRLVFQNPRGLHGVYAFFFVPVPGTWAYKYSSDGVVWSPQLGGIAGRLGSASVWVHDSGAQLVVHLVVSGTDYGSIIYRRGTISDSSLVITWTSAQTVEPGGSNAGTFGLGITRTSNGRPVMTAVREIFTSPTYQYELWAWGGDRDAATPIWTRALLIPAVSTLAQQKTDGFTSVYSAGIDYVFVAASFARGSMPGAWDEAWVRAAWNGIAWSVGPITLLSSSDQTPRMPSVVVDELWFPHALLMPTVVGGKGGLVHFRGKSLDGTLYEWFSVSPGPLTSATLSIDLTSTPKRLKAIYHYDGGLPLGNRIYWREGPTDTMNWGPENFIQWNDAALHLSSSQREFVGSIHGLAESPRGVYYFNI